MLQVAEKGSWQERVQLYHARKLAHACLDQLWKDGMFTRKEAYQILQDVTGFRHISDMDVAKCRDMILRFIVLGLA